MSWLGWGAPTNPQYEELVERVCSPLNLPYPQSEDIATSLEITDMIRSKAVLPKPAMQSLKRRIASKNGRVQMYALGLVDTCIKNGGDHFLAEIASKEFVDEMSNVVKSPATNAEVKQMALKMFQQWALAFESKKELSFFVDVYREMKNSGISFPPPPTIQSSHVLTTETAPQWVDSDVCMRCRTAFTFTNRKHHCRNCGLVFDQACSSRTMAIPKFGITDEVRVCESCWIKSGKGKVTNGPALPGRTPRSRQDLDADLQRAIELSLAESQPGGSNHIPSEPPLALKHGSAEDDDEELRLAIEASLKEMERARPSAPTGLDDLEFKPLPTFDLTPRETETILTFSNTLDQMAAYGERDLRRFPHVHLLYEQAYVIGGKLQRNAEEKTTKQQMLAEMQAKLSEAVRLYGSILDGQQAFAARKVHEEQIRHQQKQQQQYSYYPGYQQYAPTQPNGHAYGYAPQVYPSYAPAQPTVAPPTAAAPSLYPTMPTISQYQPQQAHPQLYPAQHVASFSASSQPLPQPQSQQHQRAPPLQEIPPQATDYHISPATTHVPSFPQRQASATYSSTAPSISTQEILAPVAPVFEASAPPAVDMASHPSLSPSSVTSALPSAPPASYSIPTSTPSAPVRSTSCTSQTIPTAPLASSPRQMSVETQYQGYSGPSTTAAPAQSHAEQAPLHNQEPSQNVPVSSSDSALVDAQPQSHWTPTPAVQYDASMFPSAPAGGLEQPKGLEKQEREEALLIEL